MRRLALLTIALALLVPATASAAWGPTQDMGPLRGEFVYDGNARGDRILVWTTLDGFAYAQARPGEQLGPPRMLPRDPTRREFAPRVEIDERGNALLVWTYFDETDPEFEIRGPGPCCDGLRARVIRRDGTVTPPKTLAPAGNAVQLADMQIAPDGTLGVFFTRSSYTTAARGVDVRFGTVARGFGPRENVFRSAAQGPFGLSFVGRRARLLYATGGTGYYTTAPAVIREIERRGKGRWRSLGTRLTRRPMIREQLQIATSSRGEQAITWVAEGRKFNRNQSVYAAVRAPGRAFRARRVAVEDHFQTAPVAIEPEGNALTGWASARRSGIVAAVRRPRGGFGSIKALSVFPERTQVDRPALDVNRRGHGLLAWAERPFDVDPLGGGRARLVAAFRNSRGSPLEHHVIEADVSYYTLAYAVTLDRAGRGHVAYEADDRLKVVAGRIGG